LGACSLEVFARVDPLELIEAAAPEDGLALYVDLLAESLYAAGRTARAQASGNSYGETVGELALVLAFELGDRESVVQGKGVGHSGKDGGRRIPEQASSGYTRVGV